MTSDHSPQTFGSTPPGTNGAVTLDDLRGLLTEDPAHCDRVARMAAAIARAIGFAEAQAADIGSAARFHDIGKSRLQRALLQKASALTDAEYDEVKRHTELGAALLQPPTDASDPALFALAAEIALTHHERWDGCGYPRGLSGGAIPLSGRIAAVADAYNAICSDRPYRPARSHDAAIREILLCSGRHFDPSAVQGLLQVTGEAMESRATRPLLSVVLMAGADDAGLSGVLHALQARMQALTGATELIVTRVGGAPAVSADAAVTPVSGASWRKARMAGLQAARGSWVMLIDAHGFGMLGDVSRLMQRADAGCALVVGQRQPRNGAGALRAVLRRMFNRRPHGYARLGYMLIRADKLAVLKETGGLEAVSLDAAPLRLAELFDCRVCVLPPRPDGAEASSGCGQSSLLGERMAAPATGPAAPSLA